MMQHIDVNFGHGNLAVLKFLRELGVTFGYDLTTTTQILTNLRKVVPWTKSCNTTHIKKGIWTMPLVDSPSTKALMEHIDQIRNVSNLENRAAVLEHIVVNSGISVSSNGIEFSVYQSDQTVVNLETLWKKGKFCDVEIVIGDSSFKAHKVVLAAASSYLNNLINSAILKFNEEEVPADAFGAIINFIYTGKISLDKNNFVSICESADLFQLEKLINICTVFKEIQESALSFRDVQLNLDDYSDVANYSDTDIFEIKSDESPPTDLQEKTEESVLNSKLNGDGKYKEPDTLQPYPQVQAEKRRVPDEKHSNKKHLVCPNCQERFSQLLSYKLHLLCHDDHPTFKCYKCHFIDTSFEKIREHIHASHSDVSVETDQSTDNEAPPEMSCSDSDDLVPCDACDRLFRSETELRAHMRTHKKSQAHRTKRTYDCNICHKNFRSSSHLKRHMLSHTGERKYCCITCGKLFLKSDHLKRHERIHTSERPFTCEKCGKTFRDKDHLKRHDLTHTQERPYFCEMCGKQFKDKSTLISHQKCHDDAAIFCDVCGKLFRTAEKLESHAKKHSETKPHSCEVCGKKFPYKGRLKKHMLRHTDARPFHCETCGKQFRDSHSLRLHQKKHTGIGLHSCLECGKQFTNACHLRRHAKVHSGVKPHACDVCKRAFARTDNLEAHRRICTVQQQMKEKNSQHGFASSAWDPVGGAGQEVAPFAGLGTDDLLPPTMVKTAMAQSFES